MKKRDYNGGVPDWAWGITWGIMIIGVLLNLALIIVRCLR